MQILFDAGLQPISNRFLNESDNSPAPKYPLRLMIDRETGYINLEKPFPIDDLRPRYEWITCFEPEDHLDDLVHNLHLLGIVP